ncbi:MAG TPA: hypothetical protein VGX68_14310 [Thermoanaerobaculia bacterium]|jgi:hypothetical protein|nr:hypothetical protein [Thermoanaerobaculia bacterium]
MMYLRLGDKVRATPIQRVTEPALPTDDDPDGVIVRASTDLLFPDEEDWILCPLRSPGTAVASAGDLDAAFEAEGKTLARMLSQLGVLIVAEEAA